MWDKNCSGAECVASLLMANSGRPTSPLSPAQGSNGLAPQCFRCLTRAFALTVLGMLLKATHLQAGSTGESCRGDRVVRPDTGNVVEALSAWIGSRQ